MTDAQAHGGGSDHGIPIHIDGKMYKVEKGVMTGSELRALPTPPIGPDYDLWQEVPGADDIKVANDQAVTLKAGMHFFSAPGTINPGA